MSMFPIWATGIIFSAVYAHMTTLFVEQGIMMDTSIGSFNIPPASLSTFDVISVVLWVPLYDRIIVTITKKFTGKERGFSMLQRIGIGLFISVLCMTASAVVEIKRLQLARELDLVDKPVPVPLSVLWQIPQYFLLGASEVFAYIGQLAFFYDQSPDNMRTLGTALSHLSFSLGNYLSSFIVTVVADFTKQGGRIGWIPDNLNKGPSLYHQASVRTKKVAIAYTLRYHHYKTDDDDRLSQAIKNCSIKPYLPALKSVHMLRQ